MGAHWIGKQCIMPEESRARLMLILGKSGIFFSFLSNGSRSKGLTCMVDWYWHSHPPDQAKILASNNLSCLVGNGNGKWKKANMKIWKNACFSLLNSTYTAHILLTPAQHPWPFCIGFGARLQLKCDIFPDRQADIWNLSPIKMSCGLQNVVRTTRLSQIKRGG